MHTRLAKIVVIAIMVSIGWFLMSRTSLQAEPLQAPPPTPTPVIKRATSNSTNVYLPLIMGGSGGTSQPIRKKGVGLTYQDCASATSVGAFWAFNWTAVPPTCPNIENVPMIWGASEVNTTLGGNSEWVLGFNEPDSANQSNLTPAQAAILWRQIEQKYPNRKLVSPAPSGANPEWLVSFRDAYIANYGTAPRLDGLAVHCYAWYASQCITHTQKFMTWANAWNVPEIWITEFSFSPTAPSNPTRALDEGKTFITWLQSQPQVTRYAWFASTMQGNEWWTSPLFRTPLVDWNTGTLTSFGNMYLPYK
jgi:hypothetical protein